MPSGKVHDSISYISVIPIFLVGITILKFDIFQSVLLTLVTFFTQIMFGPDLDTNSSQYKRWGLFKWIWFPYRKLFKHRSHLSHGLVFGPIMRFIYFIVSLIIIYCLVNYLCTHYLDINPHSMIMPQIKQTIEDLTSHNLNYYAIATAPGLFLGGAIHTLTDKVVSFFKNLI